MRGDSNMNRRNAISLLGGATLLPFGQLVRAQAAASIVDIAWCFWHEGERLYDDNFPGQIRDVNALRNECLARQAHNGSVYNSIKATPNDVLAGLLQQVEPYVQKNFDIKGNFGWTAHHEHAIGNYRNWEAQGNYNAIRSTYGSLQGHNPNARNLLAATSNGSIKNMIDAD
jgi:hypothetical protein